ncbi:glycerol-3-phosphate 1-O-acyltransferase PlsY [Aminomonas paucivorans]|uniref:glycerol-3-phosphate 1-O-acyltransferase PlsY n=1 Tax=Aminomonas paucivorans TaxID=81412 RepID=UPI003331F2F1
MDLIWLVLGYLAGSCPTGYLAAKLVRGEDIRRHGSGNIGATNVGRLMGKPWAIAVAILDMAKGGLVVGTAWAIGVRDPWILSLAGAAGVLGHNYPLWLGFKGGKGVATTFGVLFFLDWFNPWPALLGGAIWYGVMKATRYVSVASLVSLFSAAGLFFLFRAPAPYGITALALALLSTWRHRANLARLAAGTESRVGGGRP